MVSIEIKTLKEDATVCNLRDADVLLVHTKRSLWGWIIRFGTRCYWNHALMVCSTGDKVRGYDSTLVIDAKTSGAVVIKRVSEYLNRLGKYDIAVKRLEADWFQDEGQASELDFRSHICNMAVNEVDFKFGSRLMELIGQTIRQFTVIFRFLRRKIRRVCTQPNLPWNIRPAQVKAFTCGGFVQWCYFKGVSKTVEERGTDQSRLKEVIFNPRAKKKSTPFELLTTTPADLANCDKLSWKYVIKDGVMHEVLSGEDARLITMPAQLNLQKDSIHFPVDNSNDWTEKVVGEIIKAKNYISPSDQRRYKLSLLLRLAQRVAAFAPECEVCQSLQNRIIGLGVSLSDTPQMNRKNFRSYLSAIKGISRHLKHTHGLAEERQYVKRCVFTGLAFGLSLVVLGLILLSFGITILALNVTMPALVTRVFLGYTIGYILDRRVKKRGNVI